MNIRLAILIPTLERRTASLARLLAILEPQRAPGVVILTECDQGWQAGGMHIGAKRSILVNRAADLGADRIAFVDDDDRVSDDYIKQLTAAMATDPDIISIEGIMTGVGGKGPRKFTHALEYPRNSFDGHEYFQPPNHLDCVKTSLAIQVPFRKDRSFMEDQDYSRRLFPLLKTEVRVGCIYFYDYNRFKSAGE
jgi:GT2 family glycosyltransferase